MRGIGIFIFIAFSLTSFGQRNEIGVRSESLIDPNLRVLYVGLENVLSIENYDTNIFLNINYGMARKIGSINNKQEYIINVGSSAKKATIRLLKKTLTDTIIIDSVNYEISRIPALRASFGNLVDSMVTVETLLLQNQVKAFIPYYYKYQVYVNSFTMHIVTLDGLSQIIKANGNKITIEQKQLIKGLKPGDILFIEDIYCNGPTGATRRLNNIKLLVKP